MKAIGLVSGGLDSMLAVKVMQEQNIEVVALHFMAPFYRGEKTQVEASLDKNIRQQLKVDLKIVPLEADFLTMLANPRYGYGSNINPCIDCKILMLSKAKAMMSDLGGSFIFTGEVLGQRPMSQNRQMLGVIERKSGLKGLLLRPLSARLFDLTIPEKNNWVDRKKLLDISGRGRKPQLELIKHYGIKQFAWPAGGCLLTEAGFSNRVKDLISHQQLNLDNINLLKYGRQFRLDHDFILVVGKDQQDNLNLVKLAKPQDYLFEPESIPGPSALGRGILTEAIKIKCAQIVARYSDQKEKVDVRVEGEGKTQIISCFGLKPEECKQYLV